MSRWIYRIYLPHFSKELRSSPERDISLFVQAVRFGGFSEAGRDEVDRFDELGSDEGLAGRVAGALGDKEIQVGVAATRVAGPPSDAYGSRAGQQFRN